LQLHYRVGMGHRLGAQKFGGVINEESGGVKNYEYLGGDGLSQRFAGFAGDDFGDCVFLVAHQLLKAADDVKARADGCLGTPCLRCACSPDGFRYLLCVENWNAADDLLIGGIENCELLRGFCEVDGFRLGAHAKPLQYSTLTRNSPPAGAVAA